MQATIIVRYLFGNITRRIISANTAKVAEASTPLHIVRSNLVYEILS